ncbi:MAG TPA: SPFH domain-containing protein, partial [Saprospiraceae bacterium]|nr:SPFH domain-containing protein [Saprospiraceae bacterium]
MITFLPILLVVVFLLLINGLFTVKQQTAVVLERLGKFEGVKGPGLHFKYPIIDRVAGRVNLKIQQLDVLVETKTEDNVFV